MSSCPFLLQKSFDNSVPVSVFLPNQVSHKCFSLEQTKCSKRPVTYALNEYGFRKTNIEQDNNYLFVGCSNTFGQGIDEEFTWPALVSKCANVGCINISLPGSAPDIQALNLTWGITHYKPTAIFWYMSPPSRGTVRLDDYIYLHVPPGTFTSRHKKMLGQYAKVKIKMRNTFEMHTLWNIYTVFTLAKAHEIPVYVRCWDQEFDLEINKLREDFGFFDLGNIKFDLDKAADCAHPGPKANADYASRIVEHFGLRKVD